MTDSKHNEPTASVDLRVEIDGEGVTTATVDARVTLELASAYFDLLSRVAQQRGKEIRLLGIEVVNKCVAIATVPSSFTSAQEAAAEVDDYLTGREEPVGFVMPVRRLKLAQRALPAGHEAKIIIGPWRRELKVPSVEIHYPAVASITVRAQPVRAGGVRPRVRFTSDAEADEFTLDVTEQQARDLGASLYKDVDITATVWRDENDVIRAGKLDEFFKLDEDEDTHATLRAWFQENAREWEDIDDIEAELKRD